jgi:Arc/MetJ-type ribon-helix-helix transcriptional regulator
MQGRVCVEDIENSIKAHEVWKGRLRQAIATGISEIDSHSACRDDRCDFGKWLYATIPNASPDDGETFEAVRQLHADFHRCAGDVIACVENKDLSGAHELMEGAYRDASDVLVTLLHDWRRDLGSRDGEAPSACDCFDG